MRWLCLLVLTLSVGTEANASSHPRILIKEVVVRAPLQQVWHAWTTAEGLEFISAKSRVELKRGGPYEWFLDLPPDEMGKRGGEGARVLAWLPNEMLAFSWTFPPGIPELRNADVTYQVVVTFAEQADGTVAVVLKAHEWQSGPAWDEGWAYFDAAWSAVLNRLKAHLEKGAER